MAITVLPVRSEDPPAAPEDRPSPVDEPGARPGRQVRVDHFPERGDGERFAGLAVSAVDLTYVSRRRRPR